VRDGWIATLWWDFISSEEGIRRQSVLVLLRKVIPLFYGQRRVFIAALLLFLPVTASQLAGPQILRHIIDARVPTQDIPGLLRDSLVYAVVMLGGVAIGYGQALMLFRMGITIVTALKTRMFEHVLRLGLDFHEQYSPGKLISRVESDAETLQQLFSDASVNLLRNLVYFAGIIITLCLKNFSIAVWILVLVPLMFGATALFISRMKRWWREARAQNARVLGYITEYVQGVDVIQQFNYEETAKRRMKQVSLDKYRIEGPSSVMDYGFWGAFSLGETFAMVAVLLIGVDRVFAGTMTIGTLIMFFEYIRQMFQPIQQLSEQVNFLNRSLISVERVVGILEEQPNVSDGPADPAELKFEHEIRFEDVWFAYEEENWVLRGVSFVIPRGQRIALAGKSGGGKSTIVSLLLRFYDPQKGRISVDGRDIREFPLRAWRGLCGLVLQDVYLFPGSVGDNLRVFNTEVPQERIERFARLAHADEIIAKLPAGYSGELAERGKNLSAGERQLISFARALAGSPQPDGPPLLVLDEATSSVDPHTERLVQDALDHLLAGRTAVIVAHRLSTILNADCIILIKDGQIAEQGTHEELLARGGIYARLFKLQFSGNVVDLVGSGRAQTAT
jgi:ATP-binding cassette subfamily B protein